MNQEEEIVDRQLNAYNSGDYEEFSTCYHPDIISYRLEDASINQKMSGAHFFDHYKQKLSKNPQIHCTVLQRMRHGRLIIDKELISNNQGNQYEELVAYEVENGLITKMWFCDEIPC
ncbi:MAG: hypothetical protein QRY74_05555 [Chlamydia sp.]